MRHINDWNEIEARQEGSFPTPAPGGYIAVITSVKDDETKEYLKLEWEFALPPWAGYNGETFDRAGFWPCAIFRSYKESALGFFKAFKTAVEESNPGYVFNDREPLGLLGKRIGVVLGEETYTNKKGEPRTRLYVAQTRSVQAIQSGDFTVPALKDAPPKAARDPKPSQSAPPSNPFAELDEDDGKLPF